MIPKEISEFIFPQPATDSSGVAILKHDCGIDFQFAYMETDVITNAQLKTWRVKIDKLAALAGHNCFSYNTLERTQPGVYHDKDGNGFAILFAPGTFLEHNDVDGRPILLIVDEKSCILTGTESKAGKELIAAHLPGSLAKNVVGIDRKWNGWGAL